MKYNLHFCNRFCPLLLFFFVFELVNYNPCHGQGWETLQKAKQQFETNKYVPDSIINNLIAIHNDTLINDSLKVEVIYFFGDYLCENCLNYLIENIKTRYAYGHGESELDQDRQIAALSVLRNISNSQNRWLLMQPLLNSLKRDIRKEGFIAKIHNLLCNISNEAIAKSIIEVEILESKRQMTTPGYSVYNENLKLLLKQFEK